ncbi:MAG: fluoride efflux transporter CrcB [Deltaproteobacteria bacterium]|nr:fluoride efflux transporter CrcB [Deltaproteobacteria bacterium]
MRKLLLLAGAGAIGTLARYGLSGWVHQWLGVGFPYGTLVVNTAGCFTIGLLGTLAEQRVWFSSELRAVLFLGFLGAFTTFSSFSYETWQLVRDGQYGLAGGNVIGTMIAGFGALLLGVIAARAL